MGASLSTGFYRFTGTLIGANISAILSTLAASATPIVDDDASLDDEAARRAVVVTVALPLDRPSSQLLCSGYEARP